MTPAAATSVALRPLRSLDERLIVVLRFVHPLGRINLSIPLVALNCIGNFYPPDIRSWGIITIGGPLLVLLVLIGVVAIVVWIVQWANDHRRTRIALDILDERFARGEIDRAEYEEKRKLIGSR